MGISPRWIFVALLAASSLVCLGGCASSSTPTPPWPPTPIEPDDQNGAPIAVTPDATSLRPMCGELRERLRVVIDLAERRELNEHGPRFLKEAKLQSRMLDQIEARVDDAVRNGARPDEVDLISDDLRRFSTRLSLLADTLQSVQ